jgi:signal transduction histidine kinase
MLTLKPIRDTFSPLIEKGVKIRFVVEITEDNLDACKEVMRFAELRHLDGAQGNFAIGDRREIRMHAVVKKGVPPTQMLRSTVRSYVEQQQYVFDELWKKAIPAKARMTQIEEGIDPEVTQIITGWDNIFRNAMETFQTAKDKVDSCCDALVPSLIVNSPMYQASADFVMRGGKIRLITEITKDNISSVKELMKTQEVRHMNGCKLNFGVTSKSFTAPTSVYSLSTEPQTIESNSRALINQHQFLFDELWQKSIPAEIRIREIEQGIAPDVIETISDPDHIQRVAQRLVENANEELLVIFASTTASVHQARTGLMDLIKKKAKEGNVVVRILTPIDDANRDLVNRWSEWSSEPGARRVAIRTTETSAQSLLSIIVADRTYSLAVEFKESPSSTRGSTGLATYSNSKPTVLSYVTIFQSMWSQAELNAEIRRLYDQLKIQDQQQKEFMDMAAHEFRNPLQPILVLSEILQRHSTDARSRDLLDVVVRNAKRLQNLQQVMLDVTKIERNLLILDRQVLNLSQFVNELVKDFQAQQDTSIKISSVCQPNVYVLADKSRLAQVILNLLSNAVKFSKETIHVRCERSSDSQALVEVIDCGAGIDTEVLPRLFTKFTSKSVGGTGLGLYISKALVESHGGRIWAENVAAGGARFAFTIPLLSTASASDLYP